MAHSPSLPLSFCLPGARPLHTLFLTIIASQVHGAVLYTTLLHAIMTSTLVPSVYGHYSLSDLITAVVCCLRIYLCSRYHYKLLSC